MIAVAMLGCGYVANMYRLTLPMHSELRLVGVYDREKSRRETMARLTGTQAYAAFDALLEDPHVTIVLNLTNPRAHYKTTRALLEAGKHVYTEKPLAMHLHEARELVEFAEMRGLMLCSAPCTLLGPVAQTFWKAVREGLVGSPRLAYAEMDDGMVPRAPTAKWINEAGVPWPAVDEFEVGCTVEHAAYVLTWLCAIFGPAESVTAFSDILIPEKIPGLGIELAPDFSVSCIKFRSGLVARMTNGIYAERNHRLTIYGDDGALSVADPRSDKSRVVLRRYWTFRRRRFLTPLARRLPLLGDKERIPKYRGSQSRDFCRAVGEMARALETGESPLLGGRFSLHVLELTLACHYATSGAGAAPGNVTGTYYPTTDFVPPEPMPWAR